MSIELFSRLLLLLGLLSTCSSSSQSFIERWLQQGPVALPDDVAPGGSSSDEIVRFGFVFGFFADELTPNTEVTRRDVEGVICQIQYFFSSIVQNATKSKSVHARATEIFWGFYEDQVDAYPAHINFTITFEDSAVEGDVNAVDEQILINEMENLGEKGLENFIINWVWGAEPEHNFFKNANRMAFDGVKSPPVQGVLGNAECPETPAPSLSPTTSPMPTQSPTIIPKPTTAGGEDATAAQVDEEDALNDPNTSAQSPAAAASNPPTPVPGPGSGNSGVIEDKPDDEDEGAGNGGGNNTGLPPALTGDNVPNEVPVNDAWPFGEGKETLDDVKPMANFQLSFDMAEDHEKPPTMDEMNGLICQIDQFFTNHLRKVLVDNDIESKAVYIDWFFDETATGKDDIVVNFTSYSTYGDEVDAQVAAADVLDAMRLSSVEIQDLVEDFIWKSSPVNENVFSHTIEVGIAGETDNPKPTQAMMTQADCTPKSDTATPADDEPTTISPNPPQEAANNSVPAPVPADLAAEFGGDAKQAQIRVSFVVSNLEKIRNPQAINASGLMQSFPVFAGEVISNRTKREETRLRHLGVKSVSAFHHRRLRVSAVPGSARVTSIIENPCPENALPGLICHDVEAQYDVIMSSDEDKDQVELDTTSDTQTAVDNGSYNGVLQRVDDDTPLYIGIMRDESQIPPASAERGAAPEDDEFPWWLILVALLLLLLCCCICIYCWMFQRNKNDGGGGLNQQTTIEKEVLVEEFEDEPDRANNTGPPNQAWIDDNLNDLAMVPYQQDPNKPAAYHYAPPSGSMAPYQPGQNDSEQRRAIMDGSAKHD